MVKVHSRATGEIVGFVSRSAVARPSRADTKPRAIKNLPSFDLTGLAHLRRVAKYDFIPASLKKHVAKEKAAADAAAAACKSKSKNGGAPKPPRPLPYQLVMLCPVGQATRDEVEAALSWTTPFLDPEPPKIVIVPVPRNAPISTEHCKDLCERYWPCVYNNTNPFGPHPAIVARMTSQVGANADKWMKLARDVAEESTALGNGVGSGAVIVERLEDGEERVVAVAGDARWSAPGFKGTKGDPARHAIMRVVALVAEKRLRVDSEKHKNSTRSAVDAPTTPFPSTDTTSDSLSPLESKYFNQPDTITPRGYLCLNLTVYVTHEPCLCCTMAILHSRVGGIVFEQEMPATGGLIADRHNGMPRTGKRARARLPRLLQGYCAIEYGLFWRDDLNWKFHAWQWTDNGKGDKGSKPTQLTRNVHV